MALKVTRKEFLGVDKLDIPSPEVISAKMVLDFEVAVFQRMKDLGLRNKDLAKRLGVTPATVSKTLSETSNMTFKTAAKIANALGCVLDAPTLRIFDAEEYGTGYASSSSAVADTTTTTDKVNYTSTTRSEKKERSIPQTQTASVTSYQFDDWMMAA